MVESNSIIINPKLVVLHCIGTLEGGGAERQLCLLVTALVEKGVDCHVATIRGGVNLPLLQSSGATIHFIKASHNYDLRICAGIVSLIRTIKPDIMEIWQRPFDFFGTLAALFCRIPFVAIERTSPEHIKYDIKQFFRMRLTPFSSALIANTAQGASFWRARIKRSTPVLRIPNIIPFDMMNGLSPTLPTGHIVCVGRLAPEKNYHIIIDAYAAIHSTMPHIDLHILGTGPLEVDLKQYIKHKGLDTHVHIHGYKSPAYSYVLGAGLFISMSTFEGMPNSVIEAASLKVPLLISDIPQHNEIFDRQSAFFTHPHDVFQIGEFMRMALNSESIFLLEKMTKNAFQAIRHQTSKEISDAYLSVYNQIRNKK